MSRPVSRAVLAVVAKLVHEGLTPEQARALAMETPQRMAMIDARLAGQDIRWGSHHVAAMADDLRHSG